MEEIKKVQRSKEEMLQRLRIQLKFLRKYIDEFASTQNNDLLGEIAGKLRLLVWNGGRNKPLLIRVAQEFNIELVREIDRPRGKVTIALNDYLEELAYYTKIEDTRYSFSVMDLITLWAHQSGAAHEDWNIEKKFDVLLKSTQTDIFIGGYQATSRMFISHAISILNYGLFFLNKQNEKDKASPNNNVHLHNK